MRDLPILNPLWSETQGCEATPHTQQPQILTLRLQVMPVFACLLIGACSQLFSYFARICVNTIAEANAAINNFALTLNVHLARRLLKQLECLSMALEKREIMNINHRARGCLVAISDITNGDLVCHSIYVWHIATCS